MARKLRIEYPGAIYHVRNRGDRCEPIFEDDVDRQRSLETLGQACDKAAWQIHAFCLMGNHFHLVVETPLPKRISQRLEMGAWTHLNRRLYEQRKEERRTPG